MKTQKLVVNNPFQGIYVEGGAGSGKSASLIEPIHFEAIKKGFSGMIYDYKGNPPTLGGSAYNYWLSSGKKQNFKILNFTMPWISPKTNPIHPKYLVNDLSINEYADALMKNLNKAWIEKSDFWADNAINYTQAAIKFLKVNAPEICTLPHAISLINTDYEVVLEALASEPDIRPLIQPIIVAHEKNAEGQLSGVISSVQLPISKLYNPLIYWALNPLEEDYENDNVVDLDVSNKENPTMFVICNDPNLSTALSPVISVITSVIIKNINQKGNNPSLFSVDELPTLYIKNLDNLPATARSNKVVTLLSVQDYSQLKRDYGDKNSFTIISNMGNQFTGMTNNSETGKRISDMLGKIKKVDFSYSTSKGSTTTSEKLQHENVREQRDIMGQSIGHFTGKIAGGKPAFYSAQFENFEDSYTKQKNYSNENIPLNLPFDYPFDKEDVDMELVKAYYDEKMAYNFEQVNNEIADLLAPYKAIVDEKREK